MASKVKLKINLRDLFGGKIPGDADSIKQAVAGVIIDRIQTRTREDNKDAQGRAFKSYSPNYTASSDFQAFGKSSGDVNLTATGDMLDTLDVLDESTETITIGWDDQFNNDKAHGHINGSTHHISGKKLLPVRNFLGEGSSGNLKLSSVDKAAIQKEIALIKDTFTEIDEGIKSGDFEGSVTRSIKNVLEFDRNIITETEE